MGDFFPNYKGIPKGPARDEFDRLSEEKNGELGGFFKQQSEAFFEENKLRQSYLKTAIEFLPSYIKNEKVGDKIDFEALIKHVDVTIQKLEKSQKSGEENKEYLNSVIRLANALNDLIDEGFYQQADLTSVRTQLKERLLEINKELNNSGLILSEGR